MVAKSKKKKAKSKPAAKGAWRGKKGKGKKKKESRKAIPVIDSDEGMAPTRDGEPIRSSWRSRTHLRSQSSKTSAIMCQRKSKSSIWFRDLISVGPGREDQVTCKRCKMVIKARMA